MRQFSKTRSLDLWACSLYHKTMSEKTKKTFVLPLFIGIIILGVMNINQNSRLRNLEHNINNLHSNHISWQSRANSMQWELSNRIDSIREQIRQDAKLSFDESVLIKSYNIPDSSAYVEVSFQLKEFRTGDTVSVTARGCDGQTHRAAAARSQAGIFTAFLTLPVRSNYVLSFIAQGGTSNVSGELRRLDLADELCRRFRYHVNHGVRHGRGQETDSVTLHPYLSNNMQGNDALAINKLSLSVESGDTVVKTWDLLPYLQTRGNIQTLDTSGFLWDHFEVPIGEQPGQITPNEFAVARLVMYDNLGIRYEQIDPITIHGLRSTGGGRASATIISPPGMFFIGVERESPVWGRLRITN